GSIDHTFGGPAPTIAEPQRRAGYSANPFVITSISPRVTSIDQLYSMAIQADGKIVLGGSTQTPFDFIPSGYFAPEFALQRYNTDGSLDDGSGNDLTPDDQFGSNGNGNVQTKLGDNDAISAVA